jgi:hypothetical protein
MTMDRLTLRKIRDEADPNTVQGTVVLALCEEVERQWTLSDEMDRLAGEVERLTAMGSASVLAKLRDVEDLLSRGRPVQALGLLRWIMDGCPDDGPSAMVPAEPPERWAIVELFGHRRIVGLVDEDTIGGETLLRVRVPGGTYHGRPYPAMEQLYAPRAVWSLTRCSEEEAQMVAARYGPTQFQEIGRDVIEELASRGVEPDEPHDADGLPDSVVARVADADAAQESEIPF